MTRAVGDAEAYASIIAPAIKIGAASGGLGFLIGGTAGILKSTTPIIFGISSSLQCALLGSSFWATRQALLRPTTEAENSAGNLTQASAIAGALSGGLTGLVFRGPKVVIPRTLIMAGLSAGGQMLTNTWQRVPEPTKTTPSLWQSITSNAWSPLKTLSNEDYAALLREKLLTVEVEIAIIDDKIAALKKEETASESPAEKTKD